MIDFVKKTKLTELENKTPNVSILATKTALTVMKNKIPSVSGLVKKTDSNSKLVGWKRDLLIIIMISILLLLSLIVWLLLFLMQY